MNIPTIAATTLNCSNLIATISGTAIKAYLKTIENSVKKNVFPLDLLIFMGRVSPIKIKLITLKTVPRINPLPSGF